MDGLRSIFIQNVNYLKFKLFILSIVYRADISNNPFFKQIRLTGSERIKQMLLQNLVCGEDEFKVGILGVLKSTNKPLNFTLKPYILKLNSGEVGIFFINGFIYFIETKKDSNFLLFNHSKLKENGMLEIPLLNGEHAKHVLKSLHLPDIMINNYIK